MDVGDGRPGALLTSATASPLPLIVTVAGARGRRVTVGRK
jgi:hypothetical protein